MTLLCFRVNSSERSCWWRATFFPAANRRQHQRGIRGVSRDQLHWFPMPLILTRGTPESTHFCFRFLAIIIFLVSKKLMACRCQQTLMVPREIGKGDQERGKESGESVAEKTGSRGGVPMMKNANGSGATACSPCMFIPLTNRLKGSPLLGKMRNI